MVKLEGEIRTVFPRRRRAEEDNSSEWKPLERGWYLGSRESLLAAQAEVLPSGILLQN